MSENPADYAHWTEITIRFSDMDALGHVNNVAYAAFCEAGRVAFLRAGAPVEPTSHGWAIVRVMIEFRRECVYPGVIRVGTRLLRLGSTSMTLGQALFKDDVCVALAEGTVVRFDLSARASVPIAADFRAAYTRISEEGHP